MQDRVKALIPLAAKLPWMNLLEVGIGQTNIQDHVYFLSDEDFGELLRGAKPYQRDDLKNDLLFLLNMGSIGAEHPSWKDHAKHLLDKYGINMQNFIQNAPIDVWTYADLANHVGFRGCEVLLIDCEGYDTRILRSMIEHCKVQDDDDAWPDIIQFESAGHCDKRDGPGAEDSMIHLLENDHGYILLEWNYSNTILVHNTALQPQNGRARADRLARWIWVNFQCYWCHERGKIDRSSPQLPFTAGTCWKCFQKYKRQVLR